MRLGSAPTDRRNLTTSVLPFHAARMRGVSPSPVCTFGGEMRRRKGRGRQAEERGGDEEERRAGKARRRRKREGRGGKGGEEEKGWRRR